MLHSSQGTPFGWSMPLDLWEIYALHFAEVHTTLAQVCHFSAGHCACVWPALQPPRKQGLCIQFCFCPICSCEEDRHYVAIRFVLALQALERHW